MLTYICINAYKHRNYTMLTPYYGKVYQNNHNDYSTHKYADYQRNTLRKSTKIVTFATKVALIEVAPRVIMSKSDTKNELQM